MRQVHALQRSPSHSSMLTMCSLATTHSVHGHSFRLYLIDGQVLTYYGYRRFYMLWEVLVVAMTDVIESGRAVDYWRTLDPLRRSLT